MATSEQIKALMKAHFNKQDERFKTISLQIAASEAKKGHIKVAHEYKKIIDDYNLKNSINMEVDDKIKNLVSISLPNLAKRHLIVDEYIEEKLNRIILEYKNVEKLKEYNLLNRRKILLSGPPGTGKTMTASVLASELRLPLYTVQIDKLVTKYMGETSVKLRQIFNLIYQNQGVYLFDEFDAIGTSRDMDNDVGEIRRILNSFLQFIEQDNSQSLIICATNNPQLLDSALFRRFDDVLNYDLPSKITIKKLIENHLGLYPNKDKKIIDNELLVIAEGLSHSEIVNSCEDSIKDSILYDKKLNKKLLEKNIKDKKIQY